MNIEEQERIDAVNRHIMGDRQTDICRDINRSKKRYTILNPTRIEEMHQMDFVGPRVIRGYGAISSLNLIYVVSNRVHIEQYDSKSTDNVIGFLIPYWSNNPIPKLIKRGSMS